MSTLLPTDDQCVEFLETIDSNNNKACMIITGSLGQHVVPHVHNMSQVDSIFIFCEQQTTPSTMDQRMVENQGCLYGDRSDL